MAGGSVVPTAYTATADAEPKGSSRSKAAGTNRRPDATPSPLLLLLQVGRLWHRRDPPSRGSASAGVVVAGRSGRQRRREDDPRGGLVTLDRDPAGVHRGALPEQEQEGGGRRRHDGVRGPASRGKSCHGPAPGGASVARSATACGGGTSRPRRT